MSQFGVLRMLDLSSNLLTGDDVFITLSHCPMLEQLILVHNNLRGIPREAVEPCEFLPMEKEEGLSLNECFSHLERLDLAHNAVRTVESLLPGILIEPLRELVICGNPVCTEGQSTATENIKKKEGVWAQVRSFATEVRSELGACPINIVTTDSAK